MIPSPQEIRPLWRCQSCGGALLSPEEECTRCADGIAAHRLPDEGPHRCPSCAAWFAMPGTRREPSDAPWYRPSTVRLQCPHCGAPLRDRMRAKPRPWIGLSVVLLAVASQVWAPPAWRSYLWVACMLGFFFAMSRTRSQGVTDEHRFAPDDR